MDGNELPRFSTSSERFDFRGRTRWWEDEASHEASTVLLHCTEIVSNYGPGYTKYEPASAQITFAHGYDVSACIEYKEGEKTVQMDAIDHGLDSEQSGLLYFFDRDNAEVLIKVLDPCAVNGHRRVFVAPVTDLTFNPVVESPDGQSWTHTNRLGQSADAASHTSAFPCTA